MRISPYCTVTAYLKSPKSDTHPSEGHMASEKNWDDYLWITMRYVLTYCTHYNSSWIIVKIISLCSDYNIDGYE